MKKNQFKIVQIFIPTIHFIVFIIIIQVPNQVKIKDNESYKEETKRICNIY